MYSPQDTLANHFNFEALERMSLDAGFQPFIPVVGLSCGRTEVPANQQRGVPDQVFLKRLNAG
ncbi:MAG: hypothetical protein ACOY94_19580 [Bacillota bacterium]